MLIPLHIVYGIFYTTLSESSGCKIKFMAHDNKMIYSLALQKNSLYIPSVNGEEEI